MVSNTPFVLGHHHEMRFGLLLVKVSLRAQSPRSAVCRVSNPHILASSDISEIDETRYPTIWSAVPSSLPLHFRPRVLLATWVRCISRLGLGRSMSEVSLAVSLSLRSRLCVFFDRPDKQTRCGLGGLFALVVAVRRFARPLPMACGDGPSQWRPQNNHAHCNLLIRLYRADGMLYRQIAFLAIPLPAAGKPCPLLSACLSHGSWPLLMQPPVPL